MLMYLLFYALQRWQQDSMEISSEPRLLSIMVFLCSYNEIDGITQVVAFPFCIRHAQSALLVPPHRLRVIWACAPVGICSGVVAPWSRGTRDQTSTGQRTA
jgi:hypothetical protein